MHIVVCILFACCMGESLKFPKSLTFETPILKLAVYPLNTISSLNGQLSLDRLYNNRKTSP